MNYKDFEQHKISRCKELIAFCKNKHINDPKIGIISLSPVKERCKFCFLLKQELDMLEEIYAGNEMRFKFGSHPKWLDEIDTEDIIVRIKFKESSL